MNMIVVLSLAYVLAYPENSIQTTTVPSGSNEIEISQNGTNPTSPSIDPIITGVTRSDSLVDWEKRRREKQDCDPCTEINPFPVDLEE